jgi:hypothetical protein
MIFIIGFRFRSNIFSTLIPILKLNKNSLAIIFFQVKINNWFFILIQIIKTNFLLPMSPLHMLYRLLMLCFYWLCKTIMNIWLYIFINIIWRFKLIEWFSLYIVINLCLCICMNTWLFCRFKWCEGWINHIFYIR